MNRKLRDVLVLFAACLAFVWCVPSFGQVLKGSISGTVTDSTGAVVSGAQVKATEATTGVARTTTTDSSGLFRFNLIPPGAYKVEVTAKGFKTAVQSNVLVDAGRDTGLGGFKLTVGETSTTVEVSAEAPLIETTQAQVTNTFSGATLSTFAGVQENQGLDNLALFVPGVTASRDNGFSNSNGGGGFSSNGLRGRNNDQQIDGQNNNDNSIGGPGLFASNAEFVQQYVLITNNFGPEYGRNAGSVVNVITKSGGNAWHGSAFGTENNSVLNSLNNFDKNPDICGSGPNSNCLKKPDQLNDEFAGGTIGGPILKNKAFIFGGYDQERIGRKSTFNSSGLTPTPAGLAALAACPGIDAANLATVTQFGPFGITAGNPQIVGTPVLGVVAACPNAEFSRVGRTVPRPFTENDFIIRTDVQLGSDSITGRYYYNGFVSSNRTDNPSAGYFFDGPARAQAALISWTRNISSHSVNEARVSFGRSNFEFGGGITGPASPAAGDLANALTNVSFVSSGLLGFGPATNLPQQRIVNTWQAQDNFNYILGKHQLKAGVNWTYQRSPNIFLPAFNGAYRFQNWDAYFANTPASITIANGPPELDFREYDTFFYGGDDWKIGRNLTLNLGLTWSYYGQPANLFNDITTARESNPATAFWASTEPTVGGFLNPGAPIPLSARTLPRIPAPKNSFGPSLGFAWSPQGGGFLTGNGKTTIRGGYRMLYDPPFYNIYLNISTSAPEVFLQNIVGGPPMPANPFGANVRAALASSLTLGAFDPRTFAQTNVSPNFGPDKVQSWSLGAEREITKNSVLEARYVGNHAYNLFQTVNGNPLIGPLAANFPNLVAPGLTPCTTANAFAPAAVGRANCNEGIVRTRTNTGYSNYQAMQVDFRSSNLFKQLTLRTSYTFSKTLDNVSEIFSTFGGGNSTFTSQNPSLPDGPGEYSFSGLDVPHQWSIVATEQFPFFKEQHGLAGHILGGWTINFNYLVASGERYTPTQFFFARAAVPNYYDSRFTSTFNSGAESARPFLGNLSAPEKAVGIMAGDACFFFAQLGTEQVCGGDPTRLVSLNDVQASNAGLFDPITGLPIPEVDVTKDQVRVIVNSATSQSVFGTPFGNTPRNVVADAIQNIGNFAVIKDVKLNERMRFQFHMSMLNVLNHSNFTSVDPILEDAGLTGSFNGYGDPTQTPSVNRQIFFGAKVTF